MSIFQKLLGSGDIVSKGIELIDSFHTSETEAIEAKTKAKTDLLCSILRISISPVLSWQGHCRSARDY